MPIVLRNLLIYIKNIIPGLLALDLIIIIHELGHYAFAKLFSVKVEILSFGIGPKLLSFNINDTEYRLSSIPFGGYSRMKGSTDLTRALLTRNNEIKYIEQGSLFSISPIKRFLIYFGGPFINFLTAFLLVLTTTIIPVEHISNPAIITPISSYKNVFNEELKQPNIEKGDLLLSSGSKVFLDWEDAQNFLNENEGKTIYVTVNRNGEIINTILIPLLTKDRKYTFGLTNLQEPIIGRSITKELKPGDRIIEANGKSINYTLDLYELNTTNLDLKVIRDDKMINIEINETPLPFAWQSNLRKYRQEKNIFITSLTNTTKIIINTFKSLGALFTLNYKALKSIISTPMNVAETFSNISHIALKISFLSALRAILYLLGIISISIAVINILPLPSFDGGGMLISVFELIKRKTLNPKTYVLLKYTGLILSYLIIIIIFFILH